MTDKPDDPPGGYPPPMFAPAAEPAPEGYPPPTFAPAAEPGPESYPPPTFAPAAESGPAVAAAVPEPAVPAPASDAVVSGAIPAAASGPVLSGAILAAPAEEPLLPTSYSENDLRTAIGSPPMPEQIRPKRARPRDAGEDGDDGEPRSRKAMLVGGAALFIGLGVAALVVLGRMNAARYVVSCETKQVAAEQGRSFPPWGTSRLGGAAWKPIPIPPSFQCGALETEDPAELGEAYRKMLVERAEAMLTAKQVTQIEEAAGLLEQALLHARGDSDAHKGARQAIQRMLGDVGYHRAQAEIQKSIEALTGAAKQLEAAAGQLPRYVSDANAWATHVRKLLDELRAGPGGAKAEASPAPPLPPAPGQERPLAPAGVALPVEPDPGSAATAEPAPTPDAGVPTGGVLL